MDVFELSQKHPWKPVYPASMVRRFLGELISTNELILELRAKGALTAAAVLLDRVRTPANDACLEFLGLRPGEDERACADLLIAAAIAKHPAHRSGIQLAVPDGSPLDAEFLNARGFSFAFATYEMQNTAIQVSPHGEEIDLVAAKAQDADEIFAVLTAAFARNPETGIPEAAGWKERFTSDGWPNYRLFRESGKLLGFAQLSVEDGGGATEIRMIGVLPAARGRGIGKALLQECLRVSLGWGHGKSHLTVAAENDQALGLYLCAGFTITEKYRCYRRMNAPGGSIWEK